MHTEFPHALHLLVAAASLPTSLPAPLQAALGAALSATLLAPLPAQAQRVDVCTLVVCNASGQRAAAFTAPDPTPGRPAARPSAAASFTPPSTAPDRPMPAAPIRDPWAYRFQGRATEGEDACLLNFGLDGQLARKGTLDTHVLGRTQTWRGPAR